MTATQDIQILRESLFYNEITGDLTWRQRPINHFNSAKDHTIWHSKFIGKKVGRITSIGYLQISVCNKQYYAHRAIWAMITGSWPVGQIDHIDGNRLNNAKINLRDATNGQNRMNSHLGKNNTSGVKGVSWSKQSQKWLAVLKCDKKVVFRKYFDTKTEAAMVIQDIRQIMHREFANNGYHTKKRIS